MKIRNLTLANVRSDSVEIHWQTDEPATTKVEYGEELSAVIYNRYAPERENYTLDHRVLLLNLKPETTYHFRVVSRGRDGKVVESEDKTFTTLRENAREDAGVRGDDDGGSTLQGFAALLSPTPSPRTLGVSSQGTKPRLNPYAKFLEGYDSSFLAPTPTLPQASLFGFPYSYSGAGLNYSTYPPYPPVAVVFPPNYVSGQDNSSPQVLAQQVVPTKALSPQPTPPSAVLGTVASGGQAGGLLLLLGVLIGVVVAGVYWQLRAQASRLSANTDVGNRTDLEQPKTYEFSVG